jgi:ribosomal protein S18 acetylase RimI-like enzyme
VNEKAAGGGEARPRPLPESPPGSSAVRMRAAGPDDAAALLRLKQRLELTVMAHNHRVIGLYQRTGFSIGGRRSECLLIDGQFIDELYMAMVLPQAENI